MEQIPNPEKQSYTVPVLAMRGLVALPQTTLFVDIGRKQSVAAVRLAAEHYKYIFLTAQKNPEMEEPGPTDLYDMGVLATVANILKNGGGEQRVSFRCLCRARLNHLSVGANGALMGEIVPLEDSALSTTDSPRAEAAARILCAAFDKYLELADNVPEDLGEQASYMQDAVALAYFVGQNTVLPFEEKQEILQTEDPVERMLVVSRLLAKETEILLLEDAMNDKVRDSMNRNQRDFYLREQLKVLQEELGENGYEELPDDLEELKDRIRQSAISDAGRTALNKEFQRMLKLPQGTQEAALARSYIETCLDMPWGVYSEEKLDLAVAKKILDHDHYGLEKIKERILETLAVRHFNPENRGQILCLVGPPGTGKTSIGQSVARALNRKFVRISLGGVHDESEIRGHRRTYVGSMPGKIMNAMKEAGTSNPLLLLDEVDKLGKDSRGDPAAALLEVLDPEQNKTFRDHFLDMPFDLSKVFFITTANVEDTIPAPLLDRMDVIELTSYTYDEKRHIAEEHLVRKQMKKHGLDRTMLRITSSAINDMILYYTREAGVRNLERCIASVCRKAAKRLLEHPETKPVRVTGANLREFLGVRRFLPDRIPDRDPVGVVTGLAYTSVGGEIMPLEVNVMEGTGKIELTGSLGDVMKESAKAAISYIRANAGTLGVNPLFYKEKDIHIHAPEGAVPKDGPSAGCAMATALYSQLTGKPIRREVAMTGEITIRGNVLPIGGLKEKTMAAYKAGVKTVILPKANVPEIEELAPVVKENITFVSAEKIGDVFAAAFREGT